ncbi:YlbF family regulator [Thermosediminibacter oceani]|uniref:Uncharacterized protein n=1 Tax=Thermosediminibacter oceani (strain ATCC BAA-1034 / DSM 16646 / JW/IW-1228P) TaxID=555079 RepID=D9S2J5_THEOJ|nr:YlbF family regulator [Thermosediminibacter oceani]ADL07622.1 conserved hypothetical protein [Thermosediminibacter oceani DSM 16646]
MNAYDAAHELARALSCSPEYLEFKAAREELKKDPEAERMLKDLRAKQLEVEALRLSGKSSEEAEKQLENLFNVVSYHSGIKKYLEAESRFLVLMADIQRIIARAVDLDDWR